MHEIRVRAGQIRVRAGYDGKEHDGAELERAASGLLSGACAKLSDGENALRLREQVCPRAAPAPPALPARREGGRLRGERRRARARPPAPSRAARLVAC
jgi:hypothetical protein